MKSKINFLTLMFLMFVLLACAGGADKTSNGPEPQKAAGQQQEVTIRETSLTAEEAASHLRKLDELATLERAGGWVRGLGITESGVRESLGDYAGAVMAVYKELSWAYGVGILTREELEQSILNLSVIRGSDVIVATAIALHAFYREEWDRASAGLNLLFNETEEPDGFGRWMSLVCVLEKDKDDRRAGAAYGAIRARYTQFPEYWYRGARAFSGVIAAEYAEKCINLAPQGPFAQECREILAEHTGLKTENGLSLKTKTEIEAIIMEAVNSSNPKSLDPLLPLIELPDNPYTVYAVGALRTLSSAPVFWNYFNALSSTAKGRLAERLAYICRG